MERRRKRRGQVEKRVAVLREEDDWFRRPAGPRGPRVAQTPQETLEEAQLGLLGRGCFRGGDQDVEPAAFPGRVGEAGRAKDVVGGLVVRLVIEQGKLSREGAHRPKQIATPFQRSQGGTW